MALNSSCPNFCTLGEILGGFEWCACVCVRVCDDSFRVSYSHSGGCKSSVVYAEGGSTETREQETHFKQMSHAVGGYQAV